MPDGITLDLLKKNDHWIVYKELDESANAEPTLMIYAARFLSFDSSSNSITIQGLDHNTRNNSWVLPPKKERALTVKTISIDSSRVGMYGNEEVDYGDDDSISSSWDDTAQTSDTHLFQTATSLPIGDTDWSSTNPYGNSLELHRPEWTTQ
ncbi:hypothetical protein Pmar_PMAR000945 [Perkinsus marinus ATCC 50983]|uniref:Uncharacterized protein n=1 Tax=Perkinsus marinus (strain ATCC 50983 / TXsc) TaxID=423536 RepID=C5KNZ7_PERM5|nr:hypothetical protein Pmar_PMAR000945 [Perkinsus marinus ATCC 50983]EER13785.1 hypothetical protein Pmar_PMAR000945 [Perkinsus marinus ATCC 50983]|eukprot:XP_002781990.1 hypothetical protein Pmar_PMAR000945 [Perkinsus marinus ATCC 50983]